MTRISNLPALTTLTNELIFVAEDASDNFRTKRINFNQLLSLTVGPRGPAGQNGDTGPSGPPGPSGPSANQSLNTSNAVTFDRITVTNSSTGVTFGDGSIQVTAYKKTVRDLTEFSTGNISFTSQQINAPVLTGNPPVAGRNLYLPTADNSLAGTILIIRNRSNTNTFDIWGGLANLTTVSVTSAVQVACDGYTWFVV